MKRQVWIGLAHVVPVKQNVMNEDIGGAFVNVLALARDEQEYTSQTSSTLLIEGFKLIALENVETFAQRRALKSPSPYIIELSKTIHPDNKVVFDTFNSYPKKKQGA